MATGISALLFALAEVGYLFLTEHDLDIDDILRCACISRRFISTRVSDR